MPPTSDTAGELDIEFILRQLRRLEVFCKRRMPDEAVAVYVDAASSAQSRDVLEKVIGNCARYGDKFPLPKDLIDGIVAERKEWDLVPTVECRDCAGTGKIQVKKPYSGDNPMLKEMYGERLIESSEKCPRCTPTIRELPIDQKPAKRKSELKKSSWRDVPAELFEE